MSLNESIVEDAALMWFRRRQGYAGQVGELGYAIGHGPQHVPGEYTGGTLIPAFSQREKESEQGKLVGRLREAIRRLNPAIPEETRAVIQDFRITRFERSIP